MANGSPVSLDGWTAGRPVRLAEQVDEQAYASRQERTKVTLRLPKQVVDELRVWCATTKTSAQDLVAKLLVSHFRMDGQTATDQIKIDDLIDDDIKNRSKNSSSIRSSGRPDGQTVLSAAAVAALPELEREALQFYSQLPPNQPLQRDRNAFVGVAHFPRHVILSGILTTHLRAKQQIRSFKYCVGAIEEMSNPDVGPGYLEYLKDYSRRHPKEKQPNLPGVGADLHNAEFGGAG